MLSKERFEQEFGSKVFQYPKEFDALFNFALNESGGNGNTELKKTYLKNEDGFENTEKLFLLGSENKIIYEAKYLKNNFNRRVIDKQNENKIAENFLILAGDSFVFGTGLNQGYDYPSQIASKVDLKKWKIYNLGLPGMAPNDGYHQAINNKDYFEDIKEAQGILVWHYIPAQLERVIFNLSLEQKQNEFNGNKPHYILENNQLKFLGLFKERNTFEKKIQTFLSKLQTIKYFKINYPMQITNEHCDLVATLLNEYKNQLMAKKKIIKFYIILDHANRDTKHFAELKKSLDRHNILTIEIPNYDHLDFKNKEQIPIDGHPSAAKAWLYSEIIINKVMN